MNRTSPGNILIVSHEFPPFGGGGGRVLSLLCEELHRRGIALTVLTAKPPRAIRGEFPFAVRYLPTFRQARFKTSVAAMSLFIAQAVLLGLMGGLKGFDLIFSNMSIPAGIAGVALRRLLRCRQVVWYHGAEIHQNRSRGAGPLFRAAFLFVARRSSVNFFISRDLMALAGSYGTFPCPAVLPNAIGIRDDGSGQYREGGKRFTFVGRMEEVKNPLLLLEAARLMVERERLDDLHFHLVGSGRQYRAVRNLIREYGLGANVTLEPVVPHERMADLYRGTYALVIPSVVEGYPTTVLEAGSFGVPAIGSDTLGNREAIVAGETGVLCRLHDAEDLAKAMLRLADDPALRNRMGRRARERSRAFSIEKTADAFLDGVRCPVGNQDRNF